MRDPITQARARQLRLQLTNAERRLWSYLRRRHLGGYRFRRQVPVGPYIADFACLRAALVVEIDGGQHATQQARDAQRDDYLRASGFRVLRFWNNEVLQQTDAVLEIILAALRSGVPPS